MTDLVVLILIAMAGLSTVLGAIPIIKIRHLTHRVHDIILGFVAGIMLAVAILDLLLHLPEHADGDALSIGVSTVIGAVVIILLIRIISRMPLPMPFFRNKKKVNAGSAFLLFIALAIHNAPEGLATGVGYAQGLTTLGHTIAIAIAIQNIPEGLLVSITTLKETGSKRAGFGYALLSGIVEPVAGYLAFFLLAMSPQAIGIASGFAAGAMLSVVVIQLIPESHRHGYHVPATLALIVGFVIVAGMNAVLTMFGG